MRFLRRSWNLGNLLVIVGCSLLGTTLFWPSVTARRVARIESWAENICVALGRTARRHPEITVDSPNAGSELLAKLHDPDHAERLEPVSPAESSDLSPGLYFRGKHYLYAVLAPEGEGSVEVYCWPTGRLGPTSTAFFWSDSRGAMYSHNLRAKYAGFERAPRPGSALPRDDGAAPHEYKGRDDELWQALPRRESSRQKNS